MAVQAALANLGLADDGGFTGRLVRVRVIEDTSTIERTAGATYARVRIVGGGVPGTSSSQQATADGGESSGYAGLWLKLDKDSYDCTIGSGGLGGATGSNDGGNDGATSIDGVITVPGGSGSVRGVASSITGSIVGTSRNSAARGLKRACCSPGSRQKKGTLTSSSALMHHALRGAPAAGVKPIAAEQASTPRV